MISFDEFEIDTERSELRREGLVVPVEPQVFDLITFFAMQPGRVVTRDELIEGVWGGRIVSDSTISSRINLARRALGDDGSSQRIIKTISRRGFLFAPRPDRSDPAPNELQGGTQESESHPKRQGKPSIVVLPFENLSGDPDQRFFSDGIADDIITDLSRYGELFVIARQSAFAFHERQSDTNAFANELGVAYLLEGSVRRAAGRIRVSVQLSEVTSRKTLWAERFDSEVEDVLTVQDEIATVIVNTLVGQVSRRHYKRVQSSGAIAIGAYDHALKAQQIIWDFSRHAALEARREAEEAIRLDPTMARAYAILGWAHHTASSNGWNDQDGNTFESAVDYAKKAIAADPNEPWGHCVLGFTLWWRDQGRDFTRGLEEAKLAVKLNPSNAHFRMIVGATLAYMGRGEEALAEIDAAMRHNPLYPGLYLVHRARALFVAERYQEALVDADRAVLEMPQHANALAMLAACYEARDRHHQALNVIAALQGASPAYTLSFARSTLPFARAEDLELFCRFLESAGLTE